MTIKILLSLTVLSLSAYASETMVDFGPDADEVLITKTSTFNGIDFDKERLFIEEENEFIKKTTSYDLLTQEELDKEEEARALSNESWLKYGVKKVAFFTATAALSYVVSPIVAPLVYETIGVAAGVGTMHAFDYFYPHVCGTATTFLERTARDALKVELITKVHTLGRYAGTQVLPWAAKKVTAFAWEGVKAAPGAVVSVASSIGNVAKATPGAAVSVASGVGNVASSLWSWGKSVAGSLSSAVQSSNAGYLVHRLDVIQN